MAAVRSGWLPVTTLGLSLTGRPRLRGPSLRGPDINPSIGSARDLLWDTTGLSVLAPTDLVAGWRSDYTDVSGNQSEIYAANTRS